MKKFLLELWDFINSPFADIIGGSIFFIAGFLLLFRYSEMTGPCFAAFLSGCLIIIGIDSAGHGFERRKSSGSPDENKNDK